MTKKILMSVGQHKNQVAIYRKLVFAALDLSCDRFSFKKQIANVPCFLLPMHGKMYPILVLNLLRWQQKSNEDA